MKSQATAGGPGALPHSYHQAAQRARYGRQPGDKAVIIAQDYLLADGLRGNMWSDVQGDKTAKLR